MRGIKINIQLLIAIVFVITGVFINSKAEDKTIIDTSQIDVNLVPEKMTFMFGEPIYISYVVHNKSNQNLQLLVGGDYRNALGRPESFSIKTFGEDGNEVPQPEVGMSMGGLLGPQKLPAKGLYEFQLFLPDWATFRKPGNYTITAKRTLNLYKETQDIDWMLTNRTTGIETHASLKITIIPLNKEKMGEIIDQLGKKMFTAKDDPAEAAAKKLANIQDERVVQYFIKALQTGTYSIKFISLNALSKFDNLDAFEALKLGLDVTGKDFISRSTNMEVAESLAKNIKIAAIGAISLSPYPKAIPFLLSQRNNDLYEIRLIVVHAIGKMNANKAVPILEEMKNDTNETIRNEVERYLREFSLKRDFK